MAKVFKRKWKNKKGEGSTWAFGYSDTFGKRKIESGFDTKVEAETELSKRLNEIQNGVYKEINKSLTFAQIADLFMRHHAELHLKESTRDLYVTHLKNHLLPAFAKIKIVDFTPATLNEFILSKKKNTNLATGTINKFIAIIKRIFSNAHDNGLIAYNPVARVKKLKEEKIEQLSLTQKEVFAVIEAARKYEPNLYPLLHTAIFTGARQGELFALTWDKINSVEGYIKIDRSVYKNKFTTPKTWSSVRKINIPIELIKVLKEWRLKCPHSELNLVFPNENGGFMDRHNLIKRGFERVLRRAGVARVRFHDLRHTFASILLANNAHPKYVQHQLGHSSIKMTMDIYSHLMSEAHQQGVDVLNKILESSQDEGARKFGT